MTETHSQAWRSQLEHKDMYAIPCQLEKYPTCFICENLVDFNEVRLHEATLNLRMHAIIFSRLSIPSVDGKQHLSEVGLVLSSDFHCKENDGFRVVPLHPVLTGHAGLHK